MNTKSAAVNLVRHSFKYAGDNTREGILNAATIIKIAADVEQGSTIAEAVVEHVKPEYRLTMVNELCKVAAIRFDKVVRAALKIGDRLKAERLTNQWVNSNARNAFREQKFQTAINQKKQNYWRQIERPRKASVINEGLKSLAVTRQAKSEAKNWRDYKQMMPAFLESLRSNHSLAEIKNNDRTSSALYFNNQGNVSPQSSLYKMIGNKRLVRSYKLKPLDYEYRNNITPNNTFNKNVTNAIRTSENVLKQQLPEAAGIRRFTPGTPTGFSSSSMKLPNKNNNRIKTPFINAATVAQNLHDSNVSSKPYFKPIQVSDRQFLNHFGHNELVPIDLHENAHNYQAITGRMVNNPQKSIDDTTVGRYIRELDANTFAHNTWQKQHPRAADMTEPQANASYVRLNDWDGGSSVRELGQGRFIGPLEASMSNYTDGFNQNGGLLSASKSDANDLKNNYFPGTKNKLPFNLDLH